MALRNRLVWVTYGCYDSPDTAMYEAEAHEIDEHGNLLLFRRPFKEREDPVLLPIAVFKKGYWLGIEVVGSKIKVSDDGS